MFFVYFLGYTFIVYAFTNDLKYVKAPDSFW